MRARSGFNTLQKWHLTEAGKEVCVCVNTWGKIFTDGVVFLLYFVDKYIILTNELSEHHQFEEAGTNINAYIYYIL